MWKFFMLSFLILIIFLVMFYWFGLFFNYMYRFCSELCVDKFLLVLLRVICELWRLFVYKL